MAGVGAAEVLQQFAECDYMQEPAVFAGTVPTAQEVLGTDLGERTLNVDET